MNRLKLFLSYLLIIATVCSVIPAFSVGISAEDVQEPVAINLLVGEYVTVTDETGDYEIVTDNNDFTSLDTSIAEVTLIGTSGSAGTPELVAVADVVGGNEYYVGNGTKWTVISGKKILSTNNISEATIWTASDRGTYYYLTNGDYYLYYPETKPGAQISASTKTAKWNYFSKNGNTYLCPNGSQGTAIVNSGDNWVLNDSSSAPSNGAALYTASAGSSAKTEITFKGLSAGTTSVTVGGTVYNITVSKKTVEVNIEDGINALFEDSDAANAAGYDNEIVEVSKTEDGKISIFGLKDGQTTVTTANAVYTVNVDLPKYVIDYGLPVRIGFEDENSNASEIESVETLFADVSISGRSFVYSLNTVLTKVDRLTVDFTNGRKAAVLIIPATSVYYEEGFAEYSELVTVEGSTGDAVQTTSVLGSQDRYGYDKSYSERGTGMTNGSSAVLENEADSATFSFVGTGFDLYAGCSSSTGVMTVQIFFEDAFEKLVLIDTNANGEYGSLIESIAYGTPVYSYSGEYGNYTVKVLKAFDDENKILIDGFRVYGTIDDADNYYVRDLEDDPYYFNMRDVVLTVADHSESASGLYKRITSDEQAQAGAIITTSHEIDDVELMMNEGPKGELYLLSGDSLTFTVETERMASIGLRAVYLGTTVTINGETVNISSSLDMFYPVESGTVTIKNTGSDILSVTKLKICDDPGSVFGNLDEKTCAAALETKTTAEIFEEFLIEMKTVRNSLKKINPIFNSVAGRLYVKD